MVENFPKILTTMIVGYGLSTLISYKYNTFTKAKLQISEIKDKKLYLHSVH